MAVDYDGIRVSARAIIVRDGKIIVQGYEHEGFSWSCTPGGGVDQGETLTEGLKREVKEELNLDIDVGKLVYVRELRAAKRDKIFGNLSREFHQLEHFFVVTAFSGELRKGIHTDDCATDFHWVPLNEKALTEINFYPLPLRERLPREFAKAFPEGAVYLGDV